MSLLDQIKLLERNHNDLDVKISALLNSKVYSDHQLIELKKQKLEIKDQLSKLRRQYYNDHQQVDFDNDR